VITGAQYTDTAARIWRSATARPTSSTEVVKAIVDLVAAWDPVAVAIKRRGDAAAIEAELIKAGIEPEMVDGGVWSQWCGGFLNAAMSERLSHSGQSQLDDAAAAAVKHELPAGGFIWDESAAGASSAALMSATLAHGALLTFGVVKKRKPGRTCPRSRLCTTTNHPLPKTNWTFSQHFDLIRRRVGTQDSAPDDRKGLRQPLWRLAERLGGPGRPVRDHPGAVVAQLGARLHPDGREDSRMASMFQAIWLPMRRTAWRVDPNGAKVTSNQVRRRESGPADRRRRREQADAAHQESVLVE
jgi:hypothetical protein